MKILEYLIFRDWIAPLIIPGIVILGYCIWCLIEKIKSKIEKICDRRNEV